MVAGNRDCAFRSRCIHLCWQPGVTVLHVLNPMDQILVEYCSVQTCLTDHAAHQNRMSRHHMTPDFWGDRLNCDFHRLACGHTVCKRDILLQVYRETRQPADAAKLIPEHVFKPVNQITRITPEAITRLQQLSSHILFGSSHADGSVGESKGFEELPINEQPLSESQIVDSWLSGQVSEDLTNAFRLLFRLTDQSGSLLDFPMFESVQCPVEGCDGRVHEQPLVDMSGYGQALVAAQDDLIIWKQAVPCGLELLTSCEPWPRQSMIGLGCLHYFHHDCLALYVQVHRIACVVF